MEYLNIHRSTIDSDEMQDAGAPARATWLFLSMYCAGQENGGRILGAKAWSERRWAKLGLSLAEVTGHSGKLWVWEGEDLVVEFYPLEQEKIMSAKRRGGRIGGRMRYRMLDAVVNGVPEGVVEGVLDGELQRKGREGKEKEGKGKEALALSDVDSCEVPSEAEVRTWASMSGVDPEFAAQKFFAAQETHAWVKNGQLLDWRRRFKRFWEEDREQFVKNRAKKNGAARAGDAGWWWSEPWETVEKALTGALLGGDEVMAARLREVLELRKS